MLPHNKAQERYRILDKCFRDASHSYTLMDLLNTVNEMLAKTDHPHTISERQLYSDIAFMKSEKGYGAKIETYRVIRTDENGNERAFVAYRYKNRSFSIYDIPLTDEQMRYVQSFICSFDLFVDASIAPWISETTGKLKKWIGNFNARPSFRFDNNSFQGGLRMREVYDYFRILMEAINLRKSVLLLFRSDSKEVFYRYHPFFLKQYLNRWYALGVTTEQPDKVLVIPLDRLYDIKDSTDAYIDYPFDPEEYFEDFIGVYDPGGEPVDVHMHIYDWGKSYFSTNPIHPSQRSKLIVENGEEVLDVHIEIKINQEFLHSIACLTECVKILSPHAVVVNQKAKIRRAMELYDMK